jgi:hypothetical protein
MAREIGSCSLNETLGTSSVSGYWLESARCRSGGERKPSSRFAVALIGSDFQRCGYLRQDLLLSLHSSCLAKSGSISKCGRFVLPTNRKYRSGTGADAIGRIGRERFRPKASGCG